MLILDIALGIVLGYVLLTIVVPLTIVTLVFGIGLCVRWVKPLFDLMVFLIFAPILLTERTIRTFWPASKLLN